jgi:hypothetical protein
VHSLCITHRVHGYMYVFIHGHTGSHAYSQAHIASFPCPRNLQLPQIFNTQTLTPEQTSSGLILLETLDRCQRSVPPPTHVFCSKESIDVKIRFASLRFFINIKCTKQKRQRSTMVRTNVRFPPLLRVPLPCQFNVVCIDVSDFDGGGAHLKY